MKAFLPLLLAALSAPALAAAPAKLTCNRQLMESYDIDGQAAPVADQNLMCPDVTANCCSYSAQIHIFKKWIVAGEKEHISSLYGQFATIFDAIFEDFTEIEHMAKEVEEETATVAGSNCHKMAKTIGRFKVSALRNQIRDIVNKANNFLLTSREGFYCTLCDAHAHPFFNLTAQNYFVSHGFCSKMVENTLNYYLFKYKFFVKISRLYSEFLTKCHLDGRFYRNNFLKNDVKFFKRDEIVGEIESCKKGFDKPGSMVACEDFCGRFNPVKFDQYLEGELDKLFQLHGFFQKRMGWLKERRLHQSVVEKDSDPKAAKRVLQETGVKGAADEPNEITKFNKAFKTNLVRPIPYHFKDDLSIKYSVHFDESVIRPSQEVVYNLVEFEGDVAAKGIDFHEEGISSSVDRVTAERVFDLLNPEKKDGKSLDGYLKK